MKRRAFTLLEVLLSVAIFLLIAGAVFAAVSAGVRSTTELARHRLEAERLDTLLNYLRNAFANLPPETELTVRKRDLPAGAATELLFRRAPGAFPLMDAGASQAGSALGVRPLNGSYSLAVKSYRESLSEADRDRRLDEDPGWIPLLAEVKRIRWRFVADGSTELAEIWDFGQGRPRLVEMTLWLEGEDPIVAQFWIPQVVPFRGGKS